MAELNDAMTLPEILGQLKDIEVPAPVSYAPETAGWVVLAVVLVIAFLASGYWIRARRATNRYRRIALAELNAIAMDLPANVVIGNAAALVKRTALSVYPRETVAPLHGADWRDFILTHSKVPAGQGLDALVLGPYQADPEHPDLAVASARKWVATHRV